MMTLKQRRSALLALIVLFLLLIFLVWYFLLRGNSSKTEETVVPVEVPSVEVRDTTPSTTKVEIVTPEGASARIVATNFVERFGTYSSDQPFANVPEVKELVTPEFFLTIEPLIAVAGSYDEFYGVTVRVLSVAPVTGSESAESVTYEVSAQLEAQVGSRTNSSVTYKKASATVVKRGESWLVNDFEWK